MPRPQIELGPFLLEALIERGGMGEVWRGRHKERALPIAVKILDPSKPPTARAMRAMRREVRSIASLAHPHIIQIYDYGTLPHLPPDALRDITSPWHTGAPYFVMEYAAAGSLNHITARLSWSQLRTLLLTLLGALAHAHARGVIHRDLKPGNILLRQGIDHIHDLAISDFGLAYALQDPQDTQANMREGRARLLGTPAYMGPEQIQLAIHDQGPWTDLYAVGCIAWQLIHDLPLFDSQPTTEVLRAHAQGNLPSWSPALHVPDGVRAWLRSMLATDPYQRFAFAADAARALEQLDDDASGNGPRCDLPPATPERPRLRDVGLGLYGLTPVPLIGRHEERTAITSLFQEVVASQQPAFVLLRGGAGVGKSRLASWITQHLHERGLAITLTATHEPQPQPQDGLQHMLSQELRTLDLEPQHTRQRVARYVQRWRLLDDTPVTLERDPHILAELLGSHDLDDDVAHLATPTSWPERQATLLRWLRRCAARRPLAVWIDDIQWADEALAMAHAALASAHQHALPILFIATLRDEALITHSPQELLLKEIMASPAHTVTLPILPLEPAHHAELIRAILPLHTTLATQLASHTRGNPLFTIQLVGDWVHRGALRDSAEGWILDPHTRIPLPTDLSQLWRQRIRELLRSVPPHEREDTQRALELAAALGRDVMRHEWRAVCKLEQITLPPDLVDRLLTHRMATIHQLGWCFSHELLRAAMLQVAALAGRRSSLHERCAQMIAQRYHPAAPHVDERLAYHAAEAKRART